MLNHLRYFVAIVDHGGLTAASSVLGISQPALTRSLQALEAQLDVTLLERRSGGIVVTDAGKLLLARARGLIAEEASLLQDLASLASTRDTVTYVNGSPLTALALIPRVLARIAHEHPECRISVRGDNGMNYEWKRQALRTGELDAILSIYDSELDDPALQQTPLFEPELRVVISSDHPLRQEGKVSLAELRGDRWILPPRGCSPRKVLDNEFLVNGLPPPDRAVEMSDWRIALQLVRDAKFVTAMPYHPSCFAQELEGLELLKWRFKVRPLAICLVTRTLASQRASTRIFADVVTRIVREFGAASTTV